MLLIVGVAVLLTTSLWWGMDSRATGYLQRTTLFHTSSLYGVQLFVGLSCIICAICELRAPNKFRATAGLMFSVSAILFCLALWPAYPESGLSDWRELYTTFWIYGSLLVTGLVGLIGAIHTLRSGKLHPAYGRVIVWTQLSLALLGLLVMLSGFYWHYLFV